MLDHKAPRNPYRAAVNIHQKRLMESFSLLYPQLPKLKINPDNLSELLGIDYLNYRLLHDTQFKLNLMNHIQFCMTMKVVIRKLLTDEATDAYLKDLREKEAEMHFREIDALSAEQLELARAVVLLSQKEKDMVILAILEERIILSTFIIAQLYVEKSKFTTALETRKTQFTEKLDTTFNQVNFYKQIPTENKLSIQQKIDKKLLKLEQKKKKEDHDLDLFDLIKEEAIKKIFMKHAQKHEMEPPNDKEVQKAAKDAVKLHNEFMKDVNEINGRIEEIDQQIKKEEVKREKCVQVLKEKLKKTDNPQKVNKLHEEIKNFHASTFEKLSQKRASLRAKVDEVRVIDEWLIHQHPKVFEVVVEQEREKLKTMESARKNLEAHLKKMPSNTPQFRSHHSDWAQKRLEAKRQTLEQMTKTIDSSTPVPTPDPSKPKKLTKSNIRKHLRIRQQDLTTKKQNLHSQTDPHQPKKKK